MWIGLADLLLCILSVVIVAVAPTKAKVDGVKPKAEFLITADWKVELDSDVDLWIVGPDKKPIFYGAREAGCASLDRDSLGYSSSQITLADGSLAQFGVKQGNGHDPVPGAGHYDAESTSIPTANSPRARRRSRCGSRSPASILRSRPCSPRTSPSIRSGKRSTSRASISRPTARSRCRGRRSRRSPTPTGSQAVRERAGPSRAL